MRNCHPQTPTLEERLEMLEEAWKETKKMFEEAEATEKWRKESKKKQEETIIIWETWHRIAQAINDFLKRAIRQSVQDPHTTNPDLREAACILSEKVPAAYHYLPILFTIWWIHWNRINPIEYELPLALRSLRPSPTKYNPKSLPFDLERTAWTLWYSKYRPLIEVMLAAYHARPEKPNIIHMIPIPSTRFALDFIHSSKLNLSAQSERLSKQLVSVIINLGIDPKTNDCAYFFSRPMEEDSYSDLDQLDGEIEAILHLQT